jgi:hypothetical protein
MITTINTNVENLKKAVLFYSLGTVLSFVIIAIIHLNSFLFEPYFGYAHWNNIIKTAVISGAPFGVAVWAFLTFNYSDCTIDLKFIIKIGIPILKNYLIGIFLALLIIAGTQLYIYLFGSIYCYATPYKILGFSVLLGIPLAIGFVTLKNLIIEI